MSEPVLHLPVLYNEIIHALQPRSPRRYVDATIGAGGHALGILEASRPDGRLLGLDVDPEALDVARKNLATFGERARLVRSSFLDLEYQLGIVGWASVDGILLDLGLSSMQLGSTERGFSFNIDAPLDMRFDPSLPMTAEDLVNSLSEEDLAGIIYQYGEERRSRQVARAIVNARPLYSTRQLAAVVSPATRGGSKGIHPATRTFQAIRIAVNHELEAIEAVMPLAVRNLAPGGRLAVISFHSLEDRIVKQYFRNESVDCLCPPKQPICTCGHSATIKQVNRRPIRPSDVEIRSNPRSRSARLRVAEKLGAR